MSATAWIVDVRLPAAALAAVFAVASAAKLRNRDDTAATFRSLELRQPERLAFVVPVAEVVAAVELMVMPVVGAAIALLLLAAFTVVLVRIVRRGVPVRCACFGAVTTQTGPVGWGSVVRNVVLLTLAFVVFLAAPGVSEWIW